eukprot:365630-Chlamydomonas_euryale.AAC.10
MPGRALATKLITPFLPLNCALHTWKYDLNTKTGMPTVKPPRYQKICTMNWSGFFSLRALKKSRPRKLNNTLCNRGNRPHN